MSSGLFTRSYKSPHPRLSDRSIAIVHQALERAFDIIRKEGHDLARANEDRISFLLEQTLENRLLPANNDQGIDLSFIRSVTRESATANHDESSIGRKPDLVFRIQRELSIHHDRLQDALFTECKPVDLAHPLEKHYCAVGTKTSGIERFVVGGYASSMEQALMIGYVRDGFQITQHLAQVLAVENTKVGLGEPTELSCIISSTNGQCQGLYLTTHQRHFLWESTQATPIDLYHSWHAC